VTTSSARAGAAIAIRTEGLGRRFGKLWAMRGMDLELRAGEVFGLLGPNGAGKTTTVRLLAALIGPSEGRAWVDGLDVHTQADDVRKHIGILTETPGLYERLTAAQNLDFFARLHGLDAATRAGRIERFLRLFDLWERRDDAAGTFSKGMKQKLAIARALLHEPSIVFLDEPTAALDPEAAFIVREAIESLRGAGRTIVLCTHNLDEAARLCDRIGFVRGSLLRVDSPQRLRDGDGVPMVKIELLEPLADKQLAAVRATPGVVDVGAGADPHILLVKLGDIRRDTPATVRALVEAGAGVLGVREEARSLEAVYFEVMGNRPQLEGLAA
jgi:ABC-2 type transport system ATP-binding protein